MQTIGTVLVLYCSVSCFHVIPIVTFVMGDSLVSVCVYTCTIHVHVVLISDLRNCTVLILLLARKANYIRITDMM